MTVTHRAAAQRVRSAAGERGIALMLVLWIVALLTIMAVGMTSTQRTESTLAANQLGGARFRALSDAAVHYTALKLLARPPLEAVADALATDDQQDLWVPDGQPRTWRFASETLEITIINEASLIDLNQAPRDLLGGLLGAVGVAPEDQDLLLDAILDWRDEDDLHLVNGAEDPDYDAAGRPYGAKDGPFHSREELLQVLGFDQQLYRAIAPALTVDSRQANVVQDLAPPLVRAALEGLTIEEMEELLLEEEAADIPGSDLPSLNRGGPLYRIRVSVNPTEGNSRSMESLVRVEANATPPVVVLWQRYSLGQTDRAASGDDPPDQ
jgi:general secretion pathway protein K